MSRRTDYRGAYMPNASFREMDLRGADFSYACVEGADFTGADLTEAKFLEARCSGAIFTLSILKDTMFARPNFGIWNGGSEGACLNGAIFHQARMDGVRLWGATCRGTDFSQCDVSNAKMYSTSGSGDCYDMECTGAIFSRNTPKEIRDRLSRCSRIVIKD